MGKTKQDLKDQTLWIIPVIKQEKGHTWVSPNKETQNVSSNNDVVRVLTVVVSSVLKMSQK